MARMSETLVSHPVRHDDAPSERDEFFRDVARERHFVGDAADLDPAKPD